VLASLLVFANIGLAEPSDILGNWYIKHYDMPNNVIKAAMKSDSRVEARTNAFNYCESQSLKNLTEGSLGSFKTLKLTLKDTHTKYSTENLHIKQATKGGSSDKCFWLYNQSKEVKRHIVIACINNMGKDTRRASHYFIKVKENQPGQKMVFPDVDKASLVIIHTPISGISATDRYKTTYSCMLPKKY